MSVIERETFGCYLKKLRLNESIGIRKFSRLINMSPSTYSEIERSIDLPPQDEKILESMVLTLGLTPESDEAKKLYELARRDNDNPPKYLKDYDVPVFVRDIDGKMLDAKKTEELAEYIQDN